MDRETAKQQIKQDVPCTNYLEESKNNMYCCPSCGSGHGQNGTGAVKYYPETNTWTCHACGAGHDVIDAYQLQTGCDYNAALSYLAAEIGITIERGSDAAQQYTYDRTERPQSAENRQEDKQTDGQENAPQNVDFTEYYKACADRIDDPAAVSYLTARGISIETARRFNLGYDPAADPAGAPGAMADEYKAHPTPRIIAPCTKDFYIARSIDPNTPAAFKAPNPKGTHTQLFNAASLYGGADPVFICEGIFDALSFLEAGQAAVALNGKGNGKLLLKQLQERPTDAALVIVPDNDDDLKTAADTMKRAQDLNNDLQATNPRSIVYNVAGIYHDANDALQADRAAFEAAIAAAVKESERQSLPAGLLTLDHAIKVFEAASDKYLEMQKFPELCRRAKIKPHDSIVIAADTGAGKSSLAINFIDNLNDEYPCLYFNLEMDELTILRRLVSIRTGIELDRIEGYNHDGQTAAAVNAALKRIVDRKPLQIIQDQYYLTDIEQEIQRATAGREEPTIVIIDHSLLVKTREAFSRYERFTQISEELRRISRMNNVIMFLLLQQSRSGKEGDKRPNNSSLKESGSWENDATHILFLWDNPTGGKQLLMTKNRGGAHGDFNLEYYSATQFYQEAKEQPADTARRPVAGAGGTKRDRERQQLQEWYEAAYIKTFGDVTLYDIAEAGGVSAAVVKRRLKEYGGYTIDGVQYDAAGMDSTVAEAEFIRLTPGETPSFDDDQIKMI